MVSKFKVGDRVRIKPRIGRDDEYPIGYTQQMCAHVCEYREISAVINAEKFGKHVFGKKYYEEPYLYKLDGLIYFWSSAMIGLAEECEKYDELLYVYPWYTMDSEEECDEDKW